MHINRFRVALRDARQREPRFAGLRPRQLPASLNGRSDRRAREHGDRATAGAMARDDVRAQLLAGVDPAVVDGRLAALTAPEPRRSPGS